MCRPLMVTMAGSDNIHIPRPTLWEQTASPWSTHSRCRLATHHDYPSALWTTTRATDVHDGDHSGHGLHRCQSNSYTPVHTVTHLAEIIQVMGYTAANPTATHLYTHLPLALIITLPPGGVQNIVMSMSVSVSAHISQKPHGQTSPKHICHNWTMMTYLTRSSGDIWRRFWCKRWTQSSADLTSTTTMHSPTTAT